MDTFLRRYGIFSLIGLMLWWAGAVVLDAAFVGLGWDLTKSAPMTFVLLGGVTSGLIGVVLDVVLGMIE
jgi:hypothetical protein